MFPTKYLKQIYFFLTTCLSVVLWDIAKLQNDDGECGWFWSQIMTCVSECEYLGQTTGQQRLCRLSLTHNVISVLSPIADLDFFF